MGEDGIADNDLQVVSGERDLENLDPKERAKLEKKRGLIRAGMGAAADESEDTGFEVAKASGAAMAMLGKRYKPKFAVEGLEIQDDREHGSDEVQYARFPPAICGNFGFPVGFDLFFLDDVESTSRPSFLPRGAMRGETRRSFLLLSKIGCVRPGPLLRPSFRPRCFGATWACIVFCRCP